MKLANEDPKTIDKIFSLSNDDIDSIIIKQSNFKSDSLFG